MFHILLDLIQLLVDLWKEAWQFLRRKVDEIASGKKNDTSSEREQPFQSLYFQQPGFQHANANVMQGYSTGNPYAYGYAGGAGTMRQRNFTPGIPGSPGGSSVNLGDYDRATNQDSQSSATTLPRPFHAPARHITATVAELDLPRESTPPKEQSSSIYSQSMDLPREQTPPKRVQSSIYSQTPLTQNPLRKRGSGVKHKLKPDTGTEASRSPPLAVLETALITDLSRVGGLKGSKPIVQVDRMRMLAQSQREGRGDGTAGAYPPDSFNGGAVQVPLSEVALSPGGVVEREAKEDKMQKMRQLTGGLFPTLSLKDLALLHVVGGGGFGQVWKGTWGGTPVAVKLLSNLCQNTQLPEQLLCAFEEEVTMLAQLRHPNICLFLGVCLEPPNYAIVTELVSRGSLWDALRIPGLFQLKDLPWPTGVLRRVLEGTVRGLIYLHGHSPPIIHRDLKSANLLLDETFNVKICDFGLARLRDYNTVLTANVGTIHWMAPEVLTGTQYNESADIYSVGIVMWELFTGQCPYEHMKQVEVALSVVQRGLRPIIPNCCSAAQAAVIRKCWATDPAARFTAEQLLEEINVAFPVN